MRRWEYIFVTGPILRAIDVIYLYSYHDCQSWREGQPASQHLPIQLNMTWSNFPLFANVLLFLGIENIKVYYFVFKNDRPGRFAYTWPAYTGTTQHMNQILNFLKRRPNLRWSPTYFLMNYYSIFHPNEPYLDFLKLWTNLISKGVEFEFFSFFYRMRIIFQNWRIGHIENPKLAKR